MRLCNDFSSGAYSDWYMPSKGELHLIYENLYKHSLGGLVRGFYWSSTEEDANNAWYEFFDDTSVQEVYAKSTVFYVRPIRAF